MYKDFYKLNAMPFQLTPDPSFFYASPGHKRVLSYLQYGVHRGDGFIVVTGDIGTGKTTLVRAMLNELEKERDIVAAQLVSTQLESDDLLRMVSSAFGLPDEGITKPILLKNLESFFKDMVNKGKRVLLIVDEAQNLPIQSLEELRMLSNFQENNKVLFQSFLIGQAEFRKIIGLSNLEQLRQRIIASYHLGPLNLEDTELYIEHRLKTAGWDNDPVFSKDAYAEIYDYTEGVPRRINTLCDRILLVGSLQEAHEITDDIVENVKKELDEELISGISQTEQAELDLHGDEIDQIPARKLVDLERRVRLLENYIEKLRTALSLDVSNVKRIKSKTKRK